MGALLSKFRKQPTTLEQLRKIEDGLKKIEDYKRTTERQQKKLIANVIVTLTALYILACVIVFVWYLPESFLVRLGLLILLILVPVIIYWLKRLISWYFQSKMVKANEEYADLQRKKQDIIDGVMETETFNKAKEILSKYAPDLLEKKERISSYPGTISTKTSTSDLRRRQGVEANRSTSTTSLPRYQPLPRPIPISNNPIRPWGRTEDLVAERLRNPSRGPVRPLLHPVFPRERSMSDKIVEYIIGDGPSYRYALICKFCAGHNGMALQEEFPYVAYTCCYCLSHNPARTQRLPAPTLMPTPEANQAKTVAQPAAAMQGIEEDHEEPQQKPVPVLQSSSNVKRIPATSREGQDNEVEFEGEQDENEEHAWPTSPEILEQMDNIEKAIKKITASEDEDDIDSQTIPLDHASSEPEHESKTHDNTD